MRPQNSRAKNDRSIRAAEVEVMGEHWEAYTAGTIKRVQLANGNPQIFNTSYLESIFHAVEMYVR